MSCTFAKQISNKTYPYHLNFILELLEACTASKSLKQGKALHQHILKHNHSNSLLLDKLTRLYIQCNKPHFAHIVFNTIPYLERQRKSILWNQMIRSYAWDGPYEKAIDLYQEMVKFGVELTKYTYPFVLKACSGLKDVENGVKIHYDVEKLGLGNDVYVCTALIDFYVKCGLLDRAWEVFDKMRDRDIVTWNAMISGCSSNGLYEYVIDLVMEMQKVGLKLNSYTMVAMVSVIKEASELCMGKAVHCYSVRRGFDCDVILGTGLLDMYGKCGSLVYATRIFNSMKFKNEVTWCAIIGAYISCDSTHKGFKLLKKMRLEYGISASHVLLSTIIRGCAKITDLNMGKQIHNNVVKLGCVVDLMVGNTLLSMYAKCGMINDALNFFEEMKFKDSVSYSAIISGCVQNGEANLAIKIFRKMQISNVDPELATMMGFLPACSHLAAIQHGSCAHGYSIIHGFTHDISICNALIDMYTKCGKIDIARVLFNKMDKKDVVSWNIMIIGYGIHGLGKEAILLFNKMLKENEKPNEITFIGVLCACTHSGLINEGKYWFRAMSLEYNISPKHAHYLTMVDLLSRSGLLTEAWKFILEMNIKPDVRIYNALLAGCRIYNNIELAEEVSSKINSLGSESSGNFVLLSNLYSTLGKYNEAENIRIMQKVSGIKKSPGCSWIEVEGIVHAFITGDKFHSELYKINEKLKELLIEMKKLGYSEESRYVYQDVEEEEKEEILLYHSEKLAIAYGIIKIKSEKTILVTKNLRVCGDCHNAIKYISRIVKREIVVRDNNRFHHFKDGICSCRDFW